MSPVGSHFSLSPESWELGTHPLHVSSSYFNHKLPNSTKLLLISNYVDALFILTYNCIDYAFLFFLISCIFYFIICYIITRHYLWYNITVPNAKKPVHARTRWCRDLNVQISGHTSLHSVLITLWITRSVASTATNACITWPFISLISKRQLFILLQWKWDDYHSSYLNTYTHHVLRVGAAFFPEDATLGERWEIRGVFSLTEASNKTTVQLIFFIYWYWTYPFKFLEIEWREALLLHTELFWELKHLSHLHPSSCVSLHSWNASVHQWMPCAFENALSVFVTYLQEFQQHMENKQGLEKRIKWGIFISSSWRISSEQERQTSSYQVSDF